MPFSLEGPSETCLCLKVSQWNRLLEVVDIQKYDEDIRASWKLLEFQLAVNIKEGNLVRIRKI